MKLAELVTEIKVDGMSGVNKSLGKLHGGLKKTEKAFSDAAAIGIKAFAGLGVAVAGVTKLYADQEKAEKKLETVLKSTGEAAGFTAEELKKQASELQKITTFGDEAVIEMQAVLATFTSIKGLEFQQATNAILDISTLLGQDLKSSAIQVGKALNDPIKGVSALSRVGVSFTEKQKALIKSLQETGRVAEAQQVILAELNKEFGGQAAAAADTFDGKLKQLKNSVGDLGEALGGFFIPHLQEATSSIQKFVKAVQVEVVDGLGGSLEGLDFMVVFDRFLYTFPEVEKALHKIKDITDQITKERVAFEADKAILGTPAGRGLENPLAKIVRESDPKLFRDLERMQAGDNEIQKAQLRAQQDIVGAIDNLATAGAGLSVGQ